MKFSFQVLSCMAAKDGISLHMIATSHDTRQGLVARGFTKIPTDHLTVRQYNLSIRASVQQDLKETIRSKLSDGEAFSVSFDEWTSVRNRNVHVCQSTRQKWRAKEPIIVITGNKAVSRFLQTKDILPSMSSLWNFCEQTFNSTPYYLTYQASKIQQLITSLD